METRKTQKQKIEEILAFLNNDDEIFWNTISASVRHKDRTILSIAMEIHRKTDQVFYMIADLKEA